jgi:predicted  nucleic acid-binding Zn-ribbon protein
VKQLGERIGYGRTIQLCEELWPREHSEPWTVIERKQLQAEITRLQNECDEFRRAHKVATDDCELRAREYAKLKAECDRLQTENSNLHKHVAELAEERDRLQIENENLRAELQRAGTELGTLRAVSFASVAKLEGT